MPQDATCLAILQVTSARKVLNQGFDDPQSTETCEVETSELDELNVVQENIAMYIAGYVEKRVSRLVKCEACLNALNSDNVCFSKLIKQKNREGFGLILILIRLRCIMCLLFPRAVTGHVLCSTRRERIYI